MTKKQTRQTAGFIGILLAVSSLLIPFHMMQQEKTNAAEVRKTAAESAVSADYADETTLFDSSRVHTINLIISEENWNDMTSHALEEKYVTCDAEIDGELIRNIAIRPKGNSSLTSIKNQGSTHFSFKIEFDHNDPSVTYYGLDKLSLNNLGQDPSCMKDFLAYHLMNDMGVAAPLSSYTVLQLNDEDFGLYLAVEAVEDSFCFRNYGEDYGQLYKPDSFSMDTLDTSAMLDYSEGSSLWVNEQIMSGTYYADASSGDRADILGTMLSSVFTPEQTAAAALKYISDDVNDYQDLWDSSVFKLKDEDKTRLVQSIETLNQSENPQTVLDTDSLLRYFAVHNFVNNYDGYTSLFVHNFYLHEKDGILSMIPWDYNLAFGSFNYESAVSSVLGEDSGFDAVPDTGNAMDISKSMINYPIDTPVYSLSMEDRPLLNALLSDADTLKAYHEILNKLLTDCFENGRYDRLIKQTYENIRPYVEQGLTFYEINQFEKGSEAMQNYCHYRAESVRGQLDGTIPSTTEGQQKDFQELIEPENLNLSDLADFGALVPLLDNQMITDILHIFLKEDFAYNTRGAVEAIHYYSKHPVKLMKCVPALMKTDIIRNLVVQKLLPVLGALTGIIVLMIIMLIRFRKKRSADVITIENDPFFSES